MLRAGSSSHFNLISSITKMTGEESAGTSDFSWKCVFNIEGNNIIILMLHWFKYVQGMIFRFCIFRWKVNTWKSLFALFIYCIKGNVNVCLIFPNLPNGFETGTIKTLSLTILVGILGQRCSYSDWVIQPYISIIRLPSRWRHVIWIVAVFMFKSQQTTIHSKTYLFG